MKTIATIILVVAIAWSGALSAGFCERVASSDTISCRYTDTNGSPHDAMMTISVTREGWSLMVAVFLDKDWLMLEGDGRIEFKDGTVYEIKHVTTHRDLTERGLLMEAAFFQVEEGLLHKIGNAKGTMLVFVPADKGDAKLKFWLRRFKEMEDFIAETKATIDLD